MYLTEIDKHTGLVRIDDIDDGVLAIKAFRDVINSKDLGINCMTAIALAIDHKSPINFYDDKDRPLIAMEEVTGDRRKWEWKQDLIQIALKKYNELQYDPTLEEKRIHYDRKIRKLEEAKHAEAPLEKDENGDDIPRKGPSLSSIMSDIRKINADIKEFEKNIEGHNIYDNSPVKNGYKLTRLEQKLLKKVSFYTKIR